MTGPSPPAPPPPPPAPPLPDASPSVILSVGLSGEGHTFRLKHISFYFCHSTSKIIPFIKINSHQNQKANKDKVPPACV